MTLPAEGRKGETPAWPLSRAKKREQILWADLWTRPQAVMWEKQGQHVEVAMYCRRLVEAEVPGSPVSATTAWRQLHDSLGLSTPGLRANRWRIAETTPAASSGRAQPARRSSRDRLTVVPGVADDDPA